MSYLLSRITEATSSTFMAAPSALFLCPKVFASHSRTSSILPAISGGAMVSAIRNAHTKQKIYQDTEDYYELLGLKDVRWAATEEDIKSSYRKMVLEYHP